MVANLEKQLWALIDGSQHVAHGVVSLGRTCHASEQSAESVFSTHRNKANTSYLSTRHSSMKQQPKTTNIN